MLLLLLSLLLVVLACSSLLSLLLVGVLACGSLLSKRPFLQGSSVHPLSNCVAIRISRARGPSIHHYRGNGILVHGVSLFHEDGWVEHGASMRQRREDDQVLSMVLSTRQYPTRTNRAEQTKVPRNQARQDTRTDPEGCQTIQNQYPEITSYPNHVMCFSRTVGNERPYITYL